MTTPTDVPYHYFATADHHGLAHNPLKAIVGPRPIAWVSTLSREGVGNLAPYSFFNLISDHPPMLMFSSAGYKDTVRNIAETGAFSLSLVSRAHAAGMSLSSRDFPPEIDEFDACGIQRMACRAIQPPAVAGSPVILECRAVEVKQLADLEHRPLDMWMVIGQIIGIHIARTCLTDGLYRTERANPVLRGGYTDEYWEIGDTGKFLMER